MVLYSFRRCLAGRIKSNSGCQTSELNGANRPDGRTVFSYRKERLSNFTLACFQAVGGGSKGSKILVICGNYCRYWFFRIFIEIRFWQYVIKPKAGSLKPLRIPAGVCRGPGRRGHCCAPPPTEPDVRALPHPVPHVSGSLKDVVTPDPQMPGTTAPRRLAWLSAAVTLTRSDGVQCLPRVSRQRIRSRGAPLPSDGSRWPRFPAFSGTIRALRLPALACPSAYCFRQPAPGAPAGFVSAIQRSRRRAGPATGRGLDLHAGIPFPASLPTGRSRLSQVPWRPVP